MRFQHFQAGLRPERFGKAGSRLGSGGGSGPVSDPIILSVNANGWSVATTDNPAAMDPDGPGAKFLYVLRQGFTPAGPATFIDKLTVTKRIRLPWSNQATLTNNQCCLSDCVYQDDTVMGIPNNSTKRSPKPVMNWARVDRRIIGNTLRVEAVAFHRDARDGKTLAYAEFIVSDGTNSVTAKVPNMSILGHSGDKNAVIGFAYNFDLSTLNDLSAVTVTGNGYPHVGAAVSIRASNGAADSREFRALRYFKNVSKHANPPIAVANATTGNDATGVVSLTEATAAATPFATIAGAANGLRLATALTGGFTDGCEIRIADSEVAPGTFPAFTYQSQYELTITKLSTVTQAQARIALSTSTVWRHTAIRLRDMTINRSGTAQLSNLRFVLESVVYNNASINSAIFSGASGVGYILGLTLNDAAANNLSAGTVPICMVRGAENVGGSAQIEPWLVLGCRFRNGCTPNNRGGRTLNASIVAFSEWYGMTGQWSTLGNDENIPDGAVRAQNVVEATGTAVANMFAPSADGQAGDVTGLIDWHNTFVGDRSIGRTNMLYNETSGDPRTHELTSSVGQVTPQFNTKHDIFAGANLGLPDASDRIGAWSAMFGVGFEGLFSMFSAANPSSEHPEFPGLHASLGTSGTVKSDPLFVDNKAVIASPLTAGAGNGNYRLQAGSPLIGRCKKLVLPFDLDGNMRSALGTASGAYERLA